MFLLWFFFASFINKNAFWKIGKLDITSGIIAVIAIILWMMVGEGNMAIFLAITANALAGVPTLVKSIKFPETENYIYFLTSVAALITLLTIDDWSFATYGFTIYLLIMPSLITFFVVSKIGKKFTN